MSAPVLVEKLDQSDVSGLQGSCATYATFLHA
jgi:hypothetical protein